MRPTTIRPNRRPRAPRAAPGTRRGADPVGDVTACRWSSGRLLAESDAVARRLEQLQARPWWRVSSRELDELDDRMRALRAHAGGRR